MFVVLGLCLSHKLVAKKDEITEVAVKEVQSWKSQNDFWASIRRVALRNLALGSTQLFAIYNCTAANLLYVGINIQSIQSRFLQGVVVVAQHGNLFTGGLVRIDARALMDRIGSLLPVRH